MAQRITVDRQSFEQFLRAASLLQQFSRESHRRAEPKTDPLLDLIAIQQAITQGSVELDNVMEGIVRLARKLVGGSAVGIWLFNDNEFSYRTGAGDIPVDERLRFEVLSKLEAACAPGSDFWSEERASRGRRAYDAPDYPGYVQSSIVSPIYNEHKVAGALAVFSREFAAFTERDQGNMLLLAGVLGRAFSKAAEVGLSQTVDLERAVMLEVIDRIIPRLQKMIDEQNLALSTIQEPPVVNPDQSPAAVLEEVEPDRLASLSFDAGAGEPVPATTLDDSQPPQDEVHPSPSRVGDISIPGIGVRAALGSDVDEILPPGPPLRERFASKAARMQGWLLRASQPFREGGRALQRIFRVAGERVRNVARYRPILLTLPARKLQQLARTMASSLAGGARQCRHQMHRVANYRPNLPRLPKQELGDAFRTAQLSLLQVANRVAVQFRSATRRLKVVSSLRRESAPQVPKIRNTARWAMRTLAKFLINLPNQFPDLPPLPKFHSRQTVQPVSPATATDTRTHTIRYPRRRLRLGYGPDLQRLRRAAPALLVLLVMSAFLTLEIAVRSPNQTASASSLPHPAVAWAGLTPPAIVSKPALATKEASLKTPSVKPDPGSPRGQTAGSHLQITDAAAKAALEDTTRHEIATLRRAAEHGDEVAAFQLGMAYEIGYEQQQNCAKAAEWVIRAAKQGNAAAEYNLGLRYRDGDGVPMNQQEAAKWLRKAMEQKYPGAKMVLADLTIR